MTKKRLIIAIIVVVLLGVGVGVGFALESVKPQKVSAESVQTALDGAFKDVKYVEKINVTPYGTAGELEDKTEETGAANVEFVLNELNADNMKDFIKRLPEISKAPIFYQLRAHDYIISGFTYSAFNDSKTLLVDSVGAITTADGIKEAAIRQGSTDGTNADNISVLLIAPDPTDTKALEGFVKQVSADKVDVNLVSRPNPSSLNSFTRIDVFPTDGASKLADAIAFNQKLNGLIVEGAQITATVNAGTGEGVILYTSGGDITEESMEEFVAENAGSLTLELFNSATVNTPPVVEE